MRQVWTWFCLAAAVVVAIAVASDADAKPPAGAKRTSVSGKAASVHPQASAIAPRYFRGRVAYAPRAHGTARGHGTGFADLVGDANSGFGFYPLPDEVQYHAARYRAVHRRFWWRNPVISAMAADAARNPCFIPANQAYRCGVFNPIDGVGSPFFAGYYR
jgi:hypothetical protein